MSVPLTLIGCRTEAYVVPEGPMPPNTVLLSQTMFPNTEGGALWDDPRDAEINAMILAIPKDRNGAPPSPRRIFGSLPTTDFQAITIPGLAADLEAVHAAWQDGSLERTRSWMEKMTLRLAIAGTLAVIAGVVVWRRRRARR